MAARENQQWYIEEIPAIEQDEEPGEEVRGHPVSVKCEADDNAPKAFITLDMGPAATLDTPQSKVEAPVSKSRSCISVWSVVTLSMFVFGNETFQWSRTVIFPNLYLRPATRYTALSSDDTAVGIFTKAVIDSSDSLWTCQCMLIPGSHGYGVTLD